jgi:hypothetical protein
MNRGFASILTLTITPSFQVTYVAQVGLNEMNPNIFGMHRQVSLCSSQTTADPLVDGISHGYI